MSVQLDESQFSPSLLQEKLPQYYRMFLRDFRRAAQGFVSFNTFFLSLFLLELIGFASCFSFVRDSALFAITLSTFVLTLFSYCILYFYYSAQKPEQFIQIKERFTRACREGSSLPEEEYALAPIFCDLAAYLDGFETRFYQIPDNVRPLAPLVQALSCAFYRTDLFLMKELLLQAAIQAHLAEIRSTPTLLELHASLSNTYLSLSQLYMNAKSFQKKKSVLLELERRFEVASRLAIQEFQILRDYAPNDPWVYEQLATGYRSLQKKEEEMQELDMLLKLRPHDQEALLRLGTLYFETHRNALGLRIYEELRKLHIKKAEELIRSYGSEESIVAR